MPLYGMTRKPSPPVPAEAKLDDGGAGNVVASPISIVPSGAVNCTLVTPLAGLGSVVLKLVPSTDQLGTTPGGPIVVPPRYCTPAGSVSVSVNAVVAPLGDREIT